MAKAKQDVLIRPLVNPRDNSEVPGFYEVFLGKRIPEIEGGPEALAKMLISIGGINSIAPPEKYYQFAFEVAANFDNAEVVEEVQAALERLLSGIIVSNQSILKLS